MRFVSRRRVIALSSIAVAVVVGAAVLWLVVAPRMVESRAVAALERRLAMHATVGRASVSLSGPVLRDLVLRPADGSGLEVRVGEARARAGLFDLLFNGSAAVRSVEVRDVAVTLDLADPGAKVALAAVREAISAPTAADSSTGATARDVVVRSLAADVRDAQGSLVRVTGADVTRSGGDTHATFTRLEVGEAPGDAAIVEGGDGLVAKVGGHWSVRRATVAQADLVWASRAEELESGTPPVAEPDHGHPSTAARLRALARAVLGRDVREPGAAAPSEHEPAAPSGARAASARLTALMPWLAPDATISVARTTVRTRTASGVSTVLRELDASLTGRGPGVVRARGTGRTSSGGRVGWNMELRPAQARAEGTVSFEGLPLAVVAPILPDVPWQEPETARLDGSLTVRGAADEALSVEGHVRLSSATLASRRIAPVPVRGLEVTLDGVGTWHPDTRRLDIGRGTVTMGQASVSVAGAIEWALDHYLFDLVATMPSTSCNAAVGAIPRDLLQDVAGFSFTGTIGGRVEVHIDSRQLPATRLLIDVADGCVFESVPTLADLRRFDRPFVHRVQEPDGSVFEMTTGPGTGNWVPLREVSPFIVQSVLGHEDGGFFGHHGFAVWGIREALVRNLQAGRYMQGASTITMQLVKNLFLRREKTLARKVQEVLLTWWIERAVPKHRILELYLNVIEFGPGIYGIRNACEHYFGREPVEISPGEAAFIATILPNPKAYHHNFDRGGLSPGTAGQMRRFLGIMLSRGRIDQAAFDYGNAEIDHFAFHTAGAPPPGPRIVPGSTRPIPEDADDIAYSPDAPPDDGTTDPNEGSTDSATDDGWN